ncbi:hypothetical protein SETIT_6G005400v2 [Setaria italica]|uniref:SMP domain-containing protein n=1 Tax=Setaria italica TaxID=4555 RepID=K3YK98_SETIT|nr:uncharacterized protein LOC101785689 [Setaria italica]RCV29343.1 hypothetical protein SETIT_6G005400v2 [Setaria italica]
MAQRERDMLMKHGTARTKVAGDDEMLRTGFHNGTPLEAGKIADSQPVDLFAPAPSQQQQQQQEDDDGRGSSRVIAESEPVDLATSARGVAEAANNGNNPAPPPSQGRQVMAAGGRRLGRQA